MGRRLTGLPAHYLGSNPLLPEDPPEGSPTGGSGAPAPQPEAKFTQADLEAKIAERLGRERAKFADYNDLRDKAKRLDELEAANASEIEKAVKKAVDEATAAERSRTAGILAAAEARAQAAERFQNPATAAKLLDLSGVSVGDDGAVDRDAVKALLDGLAQSDPYLLKTDKPPVPTPGQAGIGVTGGTPQPTDPRAADLAQIEADLNAGRRR